MKPQIKKSLAVAAVLTALFANAVFAANPANENTAANDTYGYHCYDDSRHHDGMRGYHHRYLTDEQRQQRQEMRAKWQSMTPEERQQARSEWRAQQDKYYEAAMSKLSDEQKAEVEAFINDRQQHRDDMRARWEKMTPEQREALHCYNSGRHYRNGNHC